MPRSINSFDDGPYISRSVLADQKEWALANKEYIKASRRRRRDSTRHFIDSVKLSAGCIDCGYDTHPRALDYDHRNPEDKMISVGKMPDKAYGWASIILEIMKCDVRCANCHRVKEANA